MVDELSGSSAAVVGEAPQVRSMFAKFDQINDPVVSSFTASIPETFRELVDKVSSKKMLATDFIINNRKMLRSFVSDFHTEAGTLTPSVEHSISLLDEPVADIIVSAHQPNLFAYGGVVKKIVLLETLKNSLKGSHRERKTINLFIIVDHDFIDETWIRLAQLPSMNHSSGIMELRLPLNDSKRWQMVCNTGLPGRNTLYHWKHKIKSWIKACADKTLDSKLFLSNFEDFWQKVVEPSYSKARSYSDFNSFVISNLVNHTWKYSTIFVRLSEISPIFEDGFKFLISNFKAYSGALKRAETMFAGRGIDTGVSSVSHVHAPLWVHCSCGSKGSVRIARENGNLALEGPCTSCKKVLHLNLGTEANVDFGGSMSLLSPRAIPIPLLLTRDLGVTCYASGTGGLGYLVDGSVVSKQLGLGLPIVAFWPSRDKYTGIGQSEARRLMQSAKIQDLDVHLRSLQNKNAEYKGIVTPLLRERSERVGAHEPLEDVLARLYLVKEEQRKLHHELTVGEKMCKAINLSPCMIDYAVNFGMSRTEDTWKQQLLQDGRLASHIVFDRRS